MKGEVLQNLQAICQRCCSKPNPLRNILSPACKHTTFLAALATCCRHRTRTLGSNHQGHGCHSNVFLGLLRPLILELDRSVLHASQESRGFYHRSQPATKGAIALSWLPSSSAAMSQARLLCQRLRRPWPSALRRLRGRRGG